MFNREGDCLAASCVPAMSTAPTAGNSLLPEIDQQRAQGKEVAFRGDAAFAKPELYEALEERDVKRAPPSRERPSAAEDYGVVDPACGTAKPQAGISI